jgi:hypothetical protein
MIDRCRETPFIGHVAPSRICICSTTISSLAPWKTPSCVNNDITAPQLPTASSSCLFLFFFFIRTHTGTSNEDAFHFFFHYSFRTTSPLALSHSHTCHRQLFTRPRLSRNPRYPVTNLHQSSEVSLFPCISITNPKFCIFVGSFFSFRTSSGVTSNPITYQGPFAVNTISPWHIGTQLNQAPQTTYLTPRSAFSKFVS